MADFARDSMLDMFTFEMGQLVEQLEHCIIESEETNELSAEAVNEIFRIMHTIKGSAAMMMYNSIADTSHKIEDMFFYIRENHPENLDSRKLTDIVLEGIDFVKAELDKIQNGEESDGDGTQIMENVKDFMAGLRGDSDEAQPVSFDNAAVPAAAGLDNPAAAPGADVQASTQADAQEQADTLADTQTGIVEAPLTIHGYDDVNTFDIVLHFDAGCEMENVRCFTVIKNLEPVTLDIDYDPNKIESSVQADIDKCITKIRDEGFKVRLITNASIQEVEEIVEHTIFLDNYKIEEVGKEVSEEVNEVVNEDVNDKVAADVQDEVKHEESAAEEGEKEGAESAEITDAKTKILEVKEQVAEPVKEEKAGVTAVSGDMEPKGNAKHYFKIMIHFEDGCEMENIRAYTVLRNIQEIAVAATHEPSDILENEQTADLIKRKGFKIGLKTNESYDRVKKILEETVFLKEMTIEDAVAGETKTLVQKPKEETSKQTPKTQEAVKPPDGKKQTGNTMISVNINKLDALLNLTGELVTSEAMVTQNPDLDGLELENFQKAVRQLRKIINDIQDTVMSMRMVPLSPTFAKMHRIVRDMCKQLDKDVALELVGESTEVDKNIIEHISDPLMHIIRNSVDHGIEPKAKRIACGKDEKGTVVLEARNSGGDVLILVKDDGGGIDKEKVMAKAKANRMLKKPEHEYTDKEIFNFIFMPGFSTNEEVTAFSGRGVGMDVVTTNIEQVGGSIIVDSETGEGTTTTLKIPLTLAIINGMIIEIDGAKYTIPINTIKESFKATEEDILHDPDGNEMIMVRGECYNVIRMHEFYGLKCEPLKADDGIMIMLENEEETIVVLANELIGEQQVVVKAIPKYIKKTRGLSGCTLLGNGDISLIVDSAGFFNI